MDAKIIFMDFQIQSMYLFDGRILSFLRTPTDLTRFLEAWHSNASSFQFCAYLDEKKNYSGPFGIYIYVQFQVSCLYP